MQLTRNEEKMLAGRYGEGYKKALEVLVQLRKFYGAECLVPVLMAYVTMGVDSSGCHINRYTDCGLAG
jgi:predicted aconitase